MLISTVLWAETIDSRSVFFLQTSHFFVGIADLDMQDFESSSGRGRGQKRKRLQWEEAGKRRSARVSRGKVWMIIVVVEGLFNYNN